MRLVPRYEDACEQEQQLAGRAKGFIDGNQCCATIKIPLVRLRRPAVLCGLESAAR
jgi:hypothetical protein